MQFKHDKFELQQMTQVIKEKAGAVGVKNFITLFKAFREVENARNGVIENNSTNFDGQEIELFCGEWVCDENGVACLDRFGFETVACNHPILPVQRLVNIDTGIEKLKLAFKKGKSWRTVIIDKRVLASSQAIIQLADFGVAVNSENSKHLVRYLTDIEHLNYDVIPELHSVGRLGWIDGYGFSPYVDNVVFDGDVSFRSLFDAVKPKGSYDKWLELCKQIRRNGATARIMLAASFASVLVAPCECLPFFVHLWGGTETGKSVGLMLATSVWANPEMGKYISTFNSTQVAQELSAGMVNSLPLIMDELQIIRDRKDFDSIIYKLAEGIGKGRGQKAGGLQMVSTWRNCILTNGEFPISNSSSGGGAVNRIIEIDCKDTKLFADPIHVVDVVRRNHGYAGQAFIELLQDEQNMEYARTMQKQIYKSIVGGEVTEKQAASASLILAADQLITEWIFHDDNALDIDDIIPYLSTKSEVSQNLRCLDFIHDFVNIYGNKFKPNGSGDYQGEVWGAIEPENIAIIKSQFDKMLLENGYNPVAFLSWAKQNNVIECEDGRTTKLKKICGKPCRCVILKQEHAELEGYIDEELPF